MNTIGYQHNALSPVLFGWFDIHAYPVPGGLAVYFRNITVRKQVEEARMQFLNIAEQAITRQPALILLDMGLPLLDGSEVAAQVRTHYGGGVPVVLMTADGKAEEKSRRIGAASYLRKPFDIDDLIQVVEQTLDRHQAD